MVDVNRLHQNRTDFELAFPGIEYVHLSLDSRRISFSWPTLELRNFEFHVACSFILERHHDPLCCFPDPNRNIPPQERNMIQVVSMGMTYKNPVHESFFF